MEREKTVLALWKAITEQDEGAMARFFMEDAVICWPNSGERFTLAAYLRANCAYPGKWFGCVERIAQDGSVSVARVWNEAGDVSRAVSFYQWQGKRISRMEEYWGDTAPAPSWRRKLKLGAALEEAETVLPAAIPMGRCGFCCGVCPSWMSGACAGCREAHVPGDCFTRDCAETQGVSFCTLCEKFPCGELMHREKATVLDKRWLRWKWNESRG